MASPRDAHGAGRYHRWLPGNCHPANRRDRHRTGGRKQKLKPPEHFMTTWDGTRLFYRAGQPPIPSPKALVLFHRGHEHSGRFEDVVNALALDDMSVFAWDARGHGLSPGERGYADSFACLVKDAEAFVRHISAAHDIPLENMVLLAHSVGAVIAAAWVHDYAPPIRGQILVSPAFRVKLYVPLAIPMLRLWRRLRVRPFIRSYVTGRLLTHDPEQIARYDTDGLISRAIAVNILLDLHDTATRVMEDAGAIHVPTLLLAAGSDWVVKLRPQRRFFVRLSSSVKKMHVFPGFYHDLLHEKDRERPVAKARQFILDAFLRPPARPLPGKGGDGFNQAEYARLAQPPPPPSPPPPPLPRPHPPPAAGGLDLSEQRWLAGDPPAEGQPREGPGRDYPERARGREAREARGHRRRSRPLRPGDAEDPLPSPHRRPPARSRSGKSGDRGAAGPGTGGRQRDLRAWRRVRPCLSRHHRSATHDRRRLGSLRALPRQRPDRQVARKI